VLRTLSIQNLAVIEDAQIDLLEGLNVFTGATGAGKSLVIGALELLLGLRASSDMVRAGADEARVSALFEIADDDLRRELQAAIDLALDDDQLLIQRRVSASGGSRASLNGQPITAGMLRRLSQTLVDIHGQYDQQYLLQPSNQLDVLDAFGKLHDRRVAYRKVFEAHRDALQRKADLETGRDLRRQQLELYEFQAAEIDQADIRPGEIEELESRRRRLTGAERLTTNLSLAYDGLYESEGSITDRLKALVHLLDELSELDESLQAPANAARESAFALDDLAFQLRRAAERVEADPQALAETEDRLHALKRLADKYGPSEAEILALREDLRSKIAELRAQEDDRDHLDAELESLSRQMASDAPDGAVLFLEQQTSRLLQERSQVPYQTAEGSAGNQTLRDLYDLHSMGCAPLEQGAAGGYGYYVAPPGAGLVVDAEYLPGVPGVAHGDDGGLPVQPLGQLGAAYHGYGHVRRAVGIVGQDASCQRGGPHPEDAYVAGPSDFSYLRIQSLLYLLRQALHLHVHLRILDTA